jgi:hypothetical protein
MKPLHPAIKYPLAIIISAIVVIPPFLKAVTDDPGTAQSKEFAEQNKRYMEGVRQRKSAQNNNR